MREKFDYEIELKEFFTIEFRLKFLINERNIENCSIRDDEAIFSLIIVLSILLCVDDNSTTTKRLEREII